MKSLRDFSMKKEGSTTVDAAKKYSGYSKDELMRALFDNVEKQKSEGTFSKSELVDFYTRMSPHLDNEQRKRLKSLIDAID